MKPRFALLLPLLFLGLSLGCAASEPVSRELASDAAAGARPFRDLPRGHWAYDAVQALSAKGMLTGFSDDTFRGDKPVTRYSFAVALARAMEQMPANRAPGQGPMAAADLATIQRLLGEFNDELSLLGVRLGSVEEKLAAFGRRSDELSQRVGRLETGDRAGVHFEGGELRLAAYNRAANTSRVETLLNARFNAGRDVTGKVGFLFDNALDGKFGEGLGVYEAYADLTGLGKPLERLRAGRFNYLLGAGMVLYDRVEGFDLLAGRGRNRYEAFYADDLILQYAFPTFSGGEGGYYYLQQAVNASNTQPFHVGLFFRGGIGERFSYGLEFSDYDNRNVTVANRNSSTRGYLARADYGAGSNFGVHAAYLVQQEDFRAFRIDHDLAWHGGASSPLEDVLQTLDAFSNGATAAKNELNGFSDLKLGLSGRPSGGKVELFAGVDDVGGRAGFVDTRASAFRVYTAAATRRFGNNSDFQLRLRRLVFDDEAPALTASTLPIPRKNGTEFRALYVVRF